jgi:hypothetical protein
MRQLGSAGKVNIPLFRAVAQFVPTLRVCRFLHIWPMKNQ